MSTPIDLNKIRALGIDQGRARQPYRGFVIVSDGRGTGGVEIIDDDGMFGRAPSMGEAFKMIDRHLGPTSPEAA